MPILANVTNYSPRRSVLGLYAESVGKSAANKSAFYVPMSRSQSGWKVANPKLLVATFREARSKKISPEVINPMTYGVVVQRS